MWRQEIAGLSQYLLIHTTPVMPLSVSTGLVWHAEYPYERIAMNASFSRATLRWPRKRLRRGCRRSGWTTRPPTSDEVGVSTKPDQLQSANLPDPDTSVCQVSGFPCLAAHFLPEHSFSSGEGRIRRDSIEISRQPIGLMMRLGGAHEGLSPNIPALKGVSLS
jgi:hypothetical protein